MKYKIFIFLIFLMVLASCNNLQDDNSNSELTSIEGVIAEKDDHNEKILVIPNINPSELEGKDLNELLSLAEENEGIYFYVSNEEYESYDVGDQVSVEYDPEGDVEESNPPNRSAVNVKSLD